jgi:hypothetical protein
MSTDYGRQRTTATDARGLQLRTSTDYSYGRQRTTATDASGLQLRTSADYSYGRRLMAFGPRSGYGGPK